MQKYISLLRGINVGGHKKILMTDLKILFEELGCENIETYIQSGNIVFESEKSGRELEVSIGKIIYEKYGFEVPVIVRTQGEFEEVVKNKPYSGENIENLYVTFLGDKPGSDGIGSLGEYSVGDDRFEIIGKEIFVLYSQKCSKSKLTNNLFEKKLKVTATTRNWKTVNRICDLFR